MLDPTYTRALEAGAVLITPNQRLARMSAQAYAQQQVVAGKCGWYTPQIYAWDGFLKNLYGQLAIHRCVDRRLLSSLEQTVVWEEVLRAEVNLTLLQPHATANALAHARDIENAYGGAAVIDSWKLSEDQRCYFKWRNAYQRLLDERKLMDQSELADYLGKNIKQEYALLPDRLLFFGFMDITAQQQRFLHAIESLGVEVTRQDLVAVEYSRDSLVIAEDDDAEIYDAAIWARNALANSERPVDQQAQSEARIGVVIPDLHQRRDQVLRLFDRVFYPAAYPSEINEAGRPYEISVGLPLLQYPVIADAIRLLNFALHRADAADLTRLLLSPYLADARSEQDQRLQFENRLRRQGIPSLSPAQMASLNSVPRGWQKLVARLQRQVRNLPRRAVDWIAWLAETLDAVGWPGDLPVESVEFQTVSAWQESVQQIAAADKLLGVCSASRFMSLLHEASAAIFQPRTSELPIQILGLLESQGIAFEKLRILGMDAESFPPSPASTPFLPLHWQIDAQVPGATTASRVSIAKHWLAQWRVQGREVVFSRAAQRHGQTLETCFELRDITIDVTGHEIDDFLKPVHTMRVLTVSDDAGQPLSAGSVVRGGARLLEDQALCPFRAYALHRLAARPLEEVRPGIDPRVKGTLLHNVMQHFWQQVNDHEGLNALEQPQLELLVRQLIERETEVLTLLPEAIVEVEKDRLQALIVNWLVTHEATRPPFTVVATEQEMAVQLCELEFNLIIDRLDELEDGSLALIDYKTGVSNKPAQWREERISNPQLPLYAVTCEKPVSVVTFAQLARNDLKFTGMSAVRNTIPGTRAPDSEIGDWQDLLSHWQAKLELLGTEVRQGVATVTPVKRACEHCPLPAVCRIDNRFVEDQTEAADPQEHE